MAARKKTASKAKRMTTKKGPAAKKAAKPAKRMTAKRAPARSAAVKKASGSMNVGRKPFSKSQFIMALCTKTGLARKEVVALIEAIPEVVKAHLAKSGPEMFSWPGLFKIVIVKKPATKARQGKNPFTGEMMMFKAKPASRRVKVRPLKQLKEMVA
jgi:nucleoid DNA-binding protein